MATARDDVDEIRREMAQIRRELHEDMQGMVAGAEAASDWHYYVRRYPLISLGAAVALGFLVVPKRKATTSEAAEEAAEETAGRLRDLLRKTKARVSRSAGTVKDSDGDGVSNRVEKKEKKAGVLGMVFGMVAPIAMRAAQNYAMHFVENWLMQQQATGMGPMAAGGPPPGATFGPSPGGFGARPGGGPRPTPGAGPGRPI